ncbi:MAG: cell wall-active antibiotics response protein [Bacteroidota bacterium]|nr:cell wall-active antibiotics response protein [Bacteroidota bacterium]
MNSHRTSSATGKVVAGLIIITVGTILLLRQMGYHFPHWLFSWPMILVVIGLINGAKSSFRNFAWLALIGLGFAFLLDQMYPFYQISKYAWPLLIIGAGLFMIFRRNHNWPNRAEYRQRWHNRRNNYETQFQSQPTNIPILNGDEPQTATATEQPYNSGTATNTNSVNSEPSVLFNPEFIDISAILGGVKRNIFSKNITGADITCFMGGAELNFSQADIQGRVIMDLTMVMGGCKLIVPSNWEVISEITAFMGGVEDRRSLAPTMKSSNSKILVLQGVALMGGLEIQSYI